MADPLDMMSINDFIRILNHVRYQVEDLETDFGFDSDEPRLRDEDLMTAVDLAIEFYWGGGLRE